LRLKNNDIEPDELQEAQLTSADRSNRYTDMCIQNRSNTSAMGLIHLEAVFSINQFSFFTFLAYVFDREKKSLMNSKKFVVRTHRQERCRWYA
jgi:transketolase